MAVLFQAGHEPRRNRDQPELQLLIFRRFVGNFGMRKLLFLASIGVGLMFASPAKAHDPIILTSDQRTPADGPLLPDGTVSFALYGTLEEPGEIGRAHV